MTELKRVVPRMNVITRGVGHVTLLVALALAVFATAPTALAGPHERDFTGTILSAHPYFPTTYFVPCDTQSPLNGIDGVWLKVGGGWANAILIPAATLDAYVNYYTRDCRLVGHTPVNEPSPYPHLGEVWLGPVPAGAAFAFVIGYAGTGSFTLQLSN